MKLFEKVEDRPTPKEVYNWKVYVYAAVASAGAASIGYDGAFIGGTLALSSFQDEFNLTSSTKSEKNLISANIVSLYQAGAFFGAFLAYPVGHYLGRRLGLLISSTLFVLGAGLMLGSNHATGLGFIYAGRVIAGLGVGSISNLIPIYISEISPPAIRGRLVGMWEIGWQSGAIVGFWINYAVTRTISPGHKQWIVPFAIQLLPGGLLLIGSFCLIESPRWLLHNGKRRQGLEALAKLRCLDQGHDYIREEVAQIDQAIEIQAATIGMKFSAPFKELLVNRSIQWRVFLGCSLFFWQNASGINAINYYSPTVFASIGISGVSTSLLTTGVFGIIKTVVTIIWILVLIEQFGRRKLLIIGALGGSICMFIVGGYIAGAKPAEHPSDTLTSGGIAAMIFFYIWTVFYTPSWSGTPWVANSEMFDQNIRTLAQACAAASNWLFSFIVARFTPQMFASMDFGVWFLFASLQLISIPYVYLLLPETKSIPLERMDLLFDRKLKPWKAHKAVMENIETLNEDLRFTLEKGIISTEPKVDADAHAIHVEKGINGN